MSIYSDSIDALLSASPSGNYLSAISTFNLLGTAVYNTNLWGGGGATLNFTGRWLDGTGGTPQIARGVAITRRHVIVSEHGSNATDTDYVFIKADGTVVTIQAGDAVQYVGKSGASDPTGVSSFRVLYLKSDLPAGLATYPLMADQSLHSNGVDNYPIVKFDQEGKVLIANCFTVGDGNLYSFVPIQPTRALYYEDAAGGDSGSPAFMLVGTQLIYYGSLTTGGNGGSGPATTDYITAILAACATLDARNQQTGYVPNVFLAPPHNSHCSLTLGIGV